MHAKASSAPTATRAVAAFCRPCRCRAACGPAGACAGRQATRKLSAQDLQRRLDDSGQPQELRPLIAQFNALLERLAVAYRQMEAFNADVAHELNTPLTTLISSCELALRKPRSEAELREVLASNLEDLRRMAGIVADMLFLSQADRGQGARLAPWASLAALAHEVIDIHEAAQIGRAHV